MSLTTVFFDLDDTLVVEDAAAEETFRAMGELARARFDLDPAALAAAVRRHARQMWLASGTYAYCRVIGISSWEGLWGKFEGEDPNLAALGAWAPDYRREAWARGLSELGIQDRSFAERLAVEFGRERRKRHRAYPDVEPVLREFRGEFRLGLITNGAPDLQREKLAGAGLAGYFELVLASGDVGIGKPDPRLFAIALDRLGVAASGAAMVGDHVGRDITGAKKAGLFGVWINRRKESVDGEPPDAAIASLTELRSALLRR